MAVVRDTPYPSFNFRVEIDGAEDAGFSEVSGIGFSTDIIEYREGTDKSNGLRKLAGLTRYDNIVLRRGVIGATTFFAWLRSIADGDQAATRNIAIILLNEDRSQEALRWILHRARIVRHVGGPLLAASSQIAIEEIVLAYERLEIS
jgi:phage tail-like protein